MLLILLEINSKLNYFSFIISLILINIIYFIVYNKKKVIKSYKVFIYIILFYYCNILKTINNFFNKVIKLLIS